MPISVAYCVRIQSRVAVAKFVTAALQVRQWSLEPGFMVLAACVHDSVYVHELSCLH